MTNDIGDWDEWSRHVLAELKRLDANQIIMNEQLTNVRTDIKLLYVKVSIYSALVGLLGGLVPVVILLMIQHI